MIYMYVLQKLHWYGYQIDIINGALFCDLLRPHINHNDMLYIIYICRLRI